ncbi:hypothetical protein P3X46_028609 [Hevea brasiliensis]|uniref:Uncharacterized protein n=1 Tax=Hevea brasiliensis TaxID=3981 RepID=A0ABQ9KRG2_HEVBR|nr:uncharacterized protein LOC110638934 [Hevea brasiliensis]KAJ9146329.1 hypothetical protein P3X46_028609 [Hevea brasiliensis]
MDGQKSQAKLTRNHSSLLRSLPTVRSSIHSLTSVAEEDLIKPEQKQLQQQQQKQELEEKIREEKRKPHRSGSTPRRTGSARFTPVLTMVSFIFFTVLSLSFFFFFYLRREEILTSENLLLALIFIAVTLFFASKNKNLINQNLTIIKQLWEANTKRLGLCTSRAKSKPVQWFIGESNADSKSKIRKEKSIIREGVEFYSNGDFYEGEFHKGKCSGSGVYNYLVNGRYEGDWIDGRYDGYGIENWARGSRYRGQYRQGLRHGYGVYKFYTGDSYAGEWCNGQSHGVGVQTCSDGSCYLGEFKCGVKHGIGVYHFRNGDRYAGEYFGDKIHGFGVYHFANGHCYEGSWHEGRKQGYGMYTFRNGDAKCGEWDGGVLKSPVPLLTDSVLRAVQAARKTAEGAINLRPVDEQVNKAVQAANRAATAARVAAVKAVQNQMEGKFCDTNV